MNVCICKLLLVVSIQIQQQRTLFFATCPKPKGLIGFMKLYSQRFEITFGCGTMVGCGCAILWWVCKFPLNAQCCTTLELQHIKKSSELQPLQGIIQMYDAIYERRWCEMHHLSSIRLPYCTCTCPKYKNKGHLGFNFWNNAWSQELHSLQDS